MCRTEIDTHGRAWHTPTTHPPRAVGSDRQTAHAPGRAGAGPLRAVDAVNEAGICSSRPTPMHSTRMTRRRNPPSRLPPLPPPILRRVDRRARARAQQRRHPHPQLPCPRRGAHVNGRQGGGKRRRRRARPGHGERSEQRRRLDLRPRLQRAPPRPPRHRRVRPERPTGDLDDRGRRRRRDRRMAAVASAAADTAAVDSGGGGWWPRGQPQRRRLRGANGRRRRGCGGGAGRAGGRGRDAETARRDRCQHVEERRVDGGIGAAARCQQVADHAAEADGQVGAHRRVGRSRSHPCGRGGGCRRR